MKWLAIAGVLAGLYGLHRLALWMESRGWLYYIHKQPSSSSLGNAVLGVQQLLQPEAKHVLEMREDQRLEQREAGGEGKTGSNRAKRTGPAGAGP